MPESSDHIVQQARQHLREQIDKCSRRAGQKIAAKFKTGKPSTDAITKPIEEEIWS